MGQQQLLLIVLGVIIVALAVVAVFPVYQKVQYRDAADGLLDRGLTVAGSAAGWKSRSDMFAGGNASYERLDAEGLETLGLDPVSPYGTFAVTSSTAESLVITGVSDRHPDVGVRVFVNGYDIDSTAVRYDGSLTLE